MRTTSLTAPPGNHALRTMRPCGAVTLAISAAAATGSGAKITPNTDTRMSTEPASMGIAPASPSAKVMSTPWATARAAATSRRRAAGSTPVTVAPRAAANSAALPVPHPRSSTRSEGCGAARSTTTPEMGANWAAVRS
jgi:hypothetical protein